MKYLVVGLGNIGARYELTRHNIGFLVLDRLADLKKGSFEQGRHAFKADIKHKGRTLHLIKPTTYMNLSGKAVNYWLKELKVPKERLLIVTDDIALPFGKLRLRPKGSAGGHNGLKNIEEMTGDQNYNRLRFGIGDSFGRGNQVDYVLENFSPKELEDLVGFMDKSIDAILSFCTLGLQRTMNQYN